MAVHSLRNRFKATVGDAILAAAEEVAAEVGVPATNLQSVAKRAGVAVGTIYNYFQDRSDLFEALYERRRSALFAALDTATREAEVRFDAQLEAYVDAVFRYFDAHRSFLRLSMDDNTPKKKEGQRTAIEQLVARAERIVRLGVKERRLRAGTAVLAANFLVAAIRTVLVTKVETSRALTDFTEPTIGLFLNGVAK
jgi:AcrR family transcriptional regulator